VPEERAYNALFLCTGNSARSILAEAMLNHLGGGRFHAYSAGSHPVGKVNPFAIELLERASLPTRGLRSKSWDEFAKPGAPVMDFIVTVCDDAAGEACPAWPGKPVTAHWGLADPAAVQGSDDEKRAAFRRAAQALRRRIELLASLPIGKLDALSMQAKLREIGGA
jgi:arsenate reductase